MARRRSLGVVLVGLVGQRAGSGGGSGPRGKRLGGLALFAALGVVTVVAVTSGSAATTTKPYTAVFSSPVAAGSSVPVTLTITNNASPQPLGSANITAATFGSSSFTITGASVTQGTATFSASLLQLRNLNLAPGGSLTVNITVTTPCAGGDYLWGITVKQSNDFNGPPGNNFTTTVPPSQLTTTVSGSCKLDWGTPPTSTKVNTLITGAPYDPTGSKVTVRAVDGNDNTITSINGPTVTLNQSHGSTSPAFSGTTETLVNGVATFTSFQSPATGTGFTFYASASGFISSPDSDPFNITLTGEPCATTGCPVFNTPLNNDKQVDTSASGSSFTFLAIDTFNLPNPLPQGCTNWLPLGSGGFQATDGRTSGQGTLKFTYYIKKTLIQKLYGTNSGQQFIPLCAGAAQLDGSGQVVKCTSATDTTGWLGKELDTSGRFTGNTKRAVCDTATGLFWGILGSFQDYTNSDPSKIIDPTMNPTVTGWDSNTTYRFFYISVPYPWDYKMG